MHQHLMRTFCFSGDEILHLLIPQSPVYPGSKLYVPVFLEQPRPLEGKVEEKGPVGPPARLQGSVQVVVVRANARKGSKIVGVEESSNNWSLK